MNKVKKINISFELKEPIDEYYVNQMCDFLKLVIKRQTNADVKVVME